MHRPSNLQLSTIFLTLCALTTQAFSQTTRSDNQHLAPSVPYTTITYPGSSRTIAYGINNLNDIVGAYTVSGNGYGFLYSGGKFKSLSYPGKTGTSAFGINDSGAIVGTYSDTSTTTQSFLLQAGTYSEIKYPHAKNTFASGINNAGQIVGNYDDDGVQHGFLYSGGAYTNIDPPGSVHTTVGGINASGEIVGTYCVSTCTTFQAFSYISGTYTDLSFPGKVQLWGINSLGDIVGNSPLSTGGEQGFFYNRSAETFVPLDIDGSSDTSAQGVNDNCSIVGFYVDPTTSTFYGYYVRSSSCP